MEVAVVGAHGKIAMLLHPLLVKRGHRVRGLVRKREQLADLESLGVEGVLCDIEAEPDISDAVGKVDAVVFAAGAGPGSGVDRKWTVDRDGALKLMRAAQANGIDRYVMVSAINVEKPRGNEVFRTYLQAKAEADQALRESELAYTILRPGRLTDEPGTGRVALGEDLERAEIPRADVAATLAEILETPELARRQLNLVSGDCPIPEAIQRVL